MTIDTRGILEKLTSSRAVVFATVLIVVNGALVALGKESVETFSTLCKWLGSFYVGGKSLEGGMAAMFANRAPDVQAVGEGAKATSTVTTAATPGETAEAAAAGAATTTTTTNANAGSPPPIPGKT